MGLSLRFREPTGACLVGNVGGIDPYSGPNFGEGPKIRRAILGHP